MCLEGLSKTLDYLENWTLSCITRQYGYSCKECILTIILFWFFPHMLIWSMVLFLV